MTVRIPADVDREDRLVANLTARQVLVLAAAGALLYAAWAATRTLVPLPVFTVAAAPLGVAAAVLALGRRDGVGMDRLALAAARWRLAPRHLACAPGGVPAPPAWLAARAAHAPGEASRPAVPAPLRLPARTVTDVGVVDLGADGVAAVAACSTVNFALRTPGEQDALVAVFGRYLHSLTAPVQILARAERLDLTGAVAELRERAPTLPHPALAQAACEHADYLAGLAADTDLLRRRVLLVLREPLAVPGTAGGLGPARPPTALAALAGLAGHRAAARRARQTGPAARRAAEARLARRLAEAVDLLAPAGIVVTPLDAGAATGVLAAACDPAGMVPPAAALAAPDAVVTGTGTDVVGGDGGHGYGADCDGETGGGWPPDDAGTAGDELDFTATTAGDESADTGAGWDDDPPHPWNGDEQDSWPHAPATPGDAVTGSEAGVSEKTGETGGASDDVEVGGWTPAGADQPDADSADTGGHPEYPELADSGGDLAEAEPDAGPARLWDDDVRGGRP